MKDERNAEIKTGRNKIKRLTAVKKEKTKNIGGGRRQGDDKEQVKRKNEIKIVCRVSNIQGITRH
jgi:hypothetical protein